MPIVTRELKHIRPQSNGTVKVQERLTSAKGRVFFHFYTAASVAAATSAMNARDMTDQLREIDFKDLLQWVQAKNDPGVFDFTDRDLTLLEGEEQLLIWFAKTRGDPAITIAWWLEGLKGNGFNVIRDRVGFTGGEGSTITQRFTFLFQAEPWLNEIVEID